jgi:hypothetical protein
LLLRHKLAQHVEAVIDGTKCFRVAAFVGMTDLNVIEVMLLDKCPFVFKGQALGNIGDGYPQHSEMSQNCA